MTVPVLNTSAAEIISAALLDAGIIRPDQIPASEDTRTALARLNTMVKGWQAQGNHLWTQTEGVVFLDVGKESYELGPGGDEATTADDFVQSETTAALLPLATTVEVKSTVGMAGPPELITINPISTGVWDVSVGTLIISGNDLELVSTAAGPASADYVLVTEVGKSYRIEVGYTRGDDNGATFTIIDPVSTEIVESVSVTASGTVVLNFTALQSSAILRWQNHLKDTDTRLSLGGSPQKLTTPNAAGNQPGAASFNWVFDVHPTVWFPGSFFQNFLNKGGGSPSFAPDYRLETNLEGSNKMIIETNGPEGISTWEPPFGIAGRRILAFGWEKLASGSKIRIYVDNLSNPLFEKIVATTSITSTAILEFGNSFIGSFYRARMYKGDHIPEAGTPSLDMNPEDHTAPSSTWNSSSSPFEQYTLVDGASVIKSTLATNFISSVSQVDITKGDNIGIKQDDNTRHWAKIVKVIDSTSVEITPGMVSASASASTVFTFTNFIERPLKIYNPRSLTVNGSDEIPIIMWSRQEYMQQPSKNSTGIPVQLYYSRQLKDGRLYVWQTASNVDQLLHFSFNRPLEVTLSSINAPDFPSEWFDALKWNLAKELLPAYTVPPATVQEVKENAATSLAEALDFDEEAGSLFLQPNFMEGV